VSGPSTASSPRSGPSRPLDVQVDARRFTGVKISGDVVLGVSTDLRAPVLGSAQREVHFPLGPSGPLCLEGHRGCATAMLSIPSMCAQISVALRRDIAYAELLTLAGSGSPAAASVVEAAGRALGRLIAAIANLAMLDTIVVSGEGLGLWGIAENDVRAAAGGRDPESSELRILLDE
jgi:predicted NBD/HSP70 family sugar kinase